MRLSGWFVTGTDTGVGKTFVTAAIAKALSAESIRVAAIKPVESGCRVTDHGMIGEDAEAIAAAAGGWQASDQRCLYRFEEPVAPGIAASRTGASIDIARLVGFVRQVAVQADVTLVEGAGGWMVPLGNQKTIADLAVALRFPVIVVARATLGTINHTLLTVDAIERRGLDVVAVALSKRPEDALSAAESNAAEIRAHWRPKVWLCEGPVLPPDLRAVFHVERPLI